MPVSVRIAEHNDIITDLSADSLLKRILSRDNLNGAYKKVKSNRGAGGVDKMSVDELLPYLREHRVDLLQQIRDGHYKPNPVRRVEIPKEEKGKFRKLGIPTAVDRVIQQAIAQILTPIYEPQFSDSNFGFRPRRGAHDALKQCRKYANEGYVYVVDMDLEKFFDTVCQSKLIEVLSRTIKDGRVLSLIHKYLNAGIIRQGVFERSQQGVPQGGPLSPLLSNIMLNELDKELEKRGHKFVRYADDCMILCKSKRSAERTLTHIIPFIEGKLFLKVNREKTSVAHISRVKYLGYGFYRYKGECRFKVHKKSQKKDDEPSAGDNPAEQSDKQGRKTAYPEAIYKRMGKLLQTGGYEGATENGGRMAPQENTGHILETVEEGKDAIPDDTAIQRAGMEGTRISQLPERAMESGTHAELHPDK